MREDFFFLVIEGADGVGKSTLANKLVEELKKNKIHAILISKGVPDIEHIIEKLKVSANYDCKAHFFLALANSVMTYYNVFEGISSKTVVVFDRYVYTTVAYNVALGMERKWCECVITDIPKPDKVIYCELDIENVLERKKVFDEVEMGFSCSENSEEAFRVYQKKVVSAYNEIIANNPELFWRVKTNDIKKELHKVINRIYDAMEKKEEVRKLAEYLNKIPITEKAEEIGTYSSPVLICLDAVLSINRQYYKFVVPRIKFFMDNYPDVTTLKQLKCILEEGLEGFSAYWQYNHIQRVETLYCLVNKFLEIVELYPEETELASLRLWSKAVGVREYNEFNVRGIGLATFQYLRLMLGASTVKPDVHIKRAIYKATNRKPNDLDSIVLFEEACKILKIETKAMDHELWLRMASASNREYEWSDGKWNDMTNVNEAVKVAELKK